ncbi:hypothetical protein HMPREF1395_00496 [Helicobacter pylori GAM112Ai]|nr:hypothetical protein HMPREF1395_00496 [Helicobacter pylori GAM112Ai]
MKGCVFSCFLLFRLNWILILGISYIKNAFALECIWSIIA